MTADAVVIRSQEPIEPNTRLVLVRHGEADCNVNQYIGGVKACRGLTDRGRAQTRLLAERLERTAELANIDALWTSVLPRAIETAEILAPFIGAPEIKRSARFSEREPGEADGLSWAEFEARYGRASAPDDEPDEPLSPGGESWVQFVDRAANALYELCAEHPAGLVCVVAHGGIIDSSLIAFLNIPRFGVGIRLHPEHTSLTEWRHSGERWRLVRYNDAAHLAEPHAKGLSSSKPPWVDNF